MALKDLRGSDMSDEGHSDSTDPPSASNSDATAEYIQSLKTCQVKHAIGGDLNCVIRLSFVRISLEDITIKKKHRLNKLSQKTAWFVLGEKPQD